MLSSGKCCYYKWYLFQNTNMTSFLQFWWYKLRNSFSFHVSHHEHNYFFKQDIGAVKLIHRDKNGKASFLTPEFGIHDSKKLDAVQAIGINFFPGRAIRLPLCPQYIRDIPLTSVSSKEEYLLLNPSWNFIHYARYDMLIIRRDANCILVICSDVSDGFSAWLEE
jgi:hypothetical protein